jgi:hypothetical protein
MTPKYQEGVDMQLQKDLDIKCVIRIIKKSTHQNGRVPESVMFYLHMRTLVGL